MSRPITDSNYINGMNPIDAINFKVWVEDFAIPKVCEQVSEILSRGLPLGEMGKLLDEQNKILESIKKDLEASIIVAKWFMDEAPKHIVMMAEEGGEIIITYDNEDNWLETNSPVEQSADKTEQE